MPTRQPAAATDKPSPDRVLITEPQMRRMHQLLHTHGWHDRADILDYLSTATGRPVESRKDLSTDEAQSVIDTLDAAPRTPTPAALAQLRAPFDGPEVGKLPRSTCKACSDLARSYQPCERHTWVRQCRECGNNHSSATMHIDFVGHADVTARLLAVDPFWTWEPFTTAELNAIPPKYRDAGLWIHLTVLGVTRPGFGDADGKSGGNAVKEAIGDALRNSAMRFGVALELWAKGDRDWHHAEKDDPSPPMDPAPPVETQAQANRREPPLPTSDELVSRLMELAGQVGTDLDGITAKWRDRHGGITVDAMVELAPVTLAPLVEGIEAYLREHPNEGAPA